MVYINIIAILSIVATSDCISTTTRICRSTKASEIRPIPDHAVCEYDRIIEERNKSVTVAEVTVVKFTSKQRTAESCLCTAKRMAWRCDTWFFGSTEKQPTYEVIKPEEQRCRDACWKREHENKIVYIDGEAPEPDCKWMQTVDVSQDVYQAEAVSGLIDQKDNRLIFPTIKTGNCTAPLLKGDKCVGDWATIIITKDVVFHECKHETYSLGTCYMFEMTHDVSESRRRLHCAAATVVDEIDLMKFFISCGNTYFETEGRLIVQIVVLNGMPLDSTTFKETYEKEKNKINNAEILDKHLMLTNTNLLNQVSSYMIDYSNSHAAKYIKWVERELCDNWKRNLALSDALLTLSPTKAAEALVGRKRFFKVTRVNKMLLYTKCVEVSFTFNDTNTNCLSRWPGKASNGMTGYYDMIEDEVFTTSVSTHCDTMDTMILEMNATHFFQLSTKHWIMKSTEKVGSLYLLEDTPMIHAPSLYNITDHESMRQMDILARTMSETFLGNNVPWKLNQPVSGSDGEVIRSTPKAISGLSSLLQSVLPHWLYNIGDILKEILFWVVVVIVLKVFGPMLYRSVKESYCCKKKQTVSRMPTLEMTEMRRNDAEAGYTRPRISRPRRKSYGQKRSNSAGPMKGLKVEYDQQHNEVSTTYTMESEAPPPLPTAPPRTTKSGIVIDSLTYHGLNDRLREMNNLS